MGLEDYSSDESRRLICTENLFAGILLLFEHKLNSLSPNNSDEALINQKIAPVLDSNMKLLRVNTLIARQIKERMDSIGINVDWKKVESIDNFRYDIFGYRSKLSKAALRDIISDIFLILKDFLILNLQTHPKDFLGEPAWNTLISVAEVYNREKADCVKTFHNVEWKSDGLYNSLTKYKCNECGSGLIFINDPQEDRDENKFTCKSCAKKWNYIEMAVDSIEKYFSREDYISYTDEDEPAIIECPECSHETFICDEQSCPLCGLKEIYICQKGGMEDIPYCEFGGNGCSYCEEKDE